MSSYYPQAGFSFAVFIFEDIYKPFGTYISVEFLAVITDCLSMHTSTVNVFILLVIDD